MHHSSQWSANIQLQEHNGRKTFLAGEQIFNGLLSIYINNKAHVVHNNIHRRKGNQGRMIATEKEKSRG